MIAYPPMRLEHTNVGRVLLVESDERAAELRRRGTLAYGPTMVEAMARVWATFPGSRVVAARRTVVALREEADT